MPFPLMPSRRIKSIPWSSRFPSFVVALVIRDCHLLISFDPVPLKAQIDVSVTAFIVFYMRYTVCVQAHIQRCPEFSQRTMLTFSRIAFENLEAASSLPGEGSLLIAPEVLRCSALHPPPASAQQRIPSAMMLNTCRYRTGRATIHYFA